MPANSIFDGHITNVLLTLCVLVEVLLQAHAKREKGLNGINSGTCIGCFSSDGAASMTLKGLDLVSPAQVGES